MTKRGRGAPSKLTEVLQKKIVKLVREGNYFSVVARVCQLDPTTIHRWYDTGEAECKAGKTEGKYYEFYLAVSAAEAQCEADLIRYLKDHSRKDTRAVLEFLARRYPERWAVKDSLRIEANVNVPHADVAKLLMEDPEGRELLGKMLLKIQKERKNDEE